MQPLKYAFKLIALLYFIDTVVAPVSVELARQRRKMSELYNERSFRKVAQAKKTHEADWEDAVQKEKTARYNKEKTSNPFKKVIYWSEEKSQNRKASKAFHGEVKTNMEIIERKKAAGVDPYVKDYRYGTN